MTEALRVLRQDAEVVSHNLVGQRLGRKGAETRERGVSAMLKLLDEADGPPVTMMSVAREASVGMTTLYQYFPDLGDLLLAALKRVMDSSEDAFIRRLRKRWPEDALGAHCLAFLQAHVKFWRRNARLLHMRNSFADAHDLRVLEYRRETSRPLLELLVMQMDGSLLDLNSPCSHLATVALIGLERMATVVTNPHFHITSRHVGASGEAAYVDQLIIAEARLFEWAIGNQRNR